MNLETVQGRTLSEQVVLVLRQAIIAGELAPGSRLMDTELAQRLQISRATVRDAFRRLQHDGLVINFPHRGYFVAEFAPSQVIEMLDLRSLLEGRAVETAVDHLTNDDLDQMEIIAESIARHDYESDIAQIRDLDITFHQLIIKRCMQPVLAELFGNLDSRLSMLNNLSGPVLKISSEESAKRHHEYISELRSRDAGRARAAAHEHYQHYVRRLREVLQDNDDHC